MKDLEEKKKYNLRYCICLYTNMPELIKVKRSESQNKTIDLESMHVEKIIVVVKIKKYIM